MAAPSLWVRRDIQLEAAKKLKEGNTRDCVELLLNNDLSFEDNGMMIDAKIDAGALLQTGLSLLSSRPHEALGLAVGANTKEIRLNYKKLAIKYHPDKNPRTTVLFQAINTACTKLSDPAQRKVEEQNAPKPSSTTRSSFHSSTASSSTKSKSATDAAAELARRAEEEKKRREEERLRSHQEAKKKYEEEVKRSRDSEEMRRQKDDIIREGQRVYQEEKMRAEKESQIRLERKAAEIAAAKSRAMNGPAAANIPGMKPFRGVVKPHPPVPQAASGPASSSASTSRPSVPEPSPRTGDPYPQQTGRTFTVDPTGNVKSHGGAARPSSGKSFPAGEHAVPKVPTGLHASAYSDTQVDLQWSSGFGLVDLNWRNCGLGADSWRTANKLIEGTKCRKKNLLAGATYEFRIRSVSEAPGGMLGTRSAWCDCITVKLAAPAKEEERSTSYAYYAGSNKFMKEVFLRPDKMRDEQPPPSVGDPKKTADSNTIPSNLRPSSINTAGRRNSTAQEVDDEPGIKVAPSSTRSKQAWAFASDSASEVDSESELDEDEEAEAAAFATRHFTWYSLVPPPGQPSYEHLVRKEPFSASRLCGYLDVGSPVQVEADCGEWVKVRVHRRAVGKISGVDKKKQDKDKVRDVWGWCLRQMDGADLLVKCHDTIHEDEDEDEDDSGDPSNINDYGVGGESYEGVWYEMEDDEGNNYFYNDYTGESSWQPPEWVQETDAESGAAYYLKLNKDDATSLHSTWTRPTQFSKLVRLPGAGGGR